MAEKPVQLKKGKLSPLAIAAIAVAVIFAVYQLISTQILFYSTISHRITHLSFALIVVFLSWLISKKHGRLMMAGIFACIILTIVITIYFQREWIEIMDLRPVPNAVDTTMALMVAAITFIACYIVWGKILPSLGFVFIAYLVLGRYLPFPFTVASLSVPQIASYLGIPGVAEGVYGGILNLSASYVFLFVFFGAALYAFGGLRFVMGLSEWVGGKLSSGPAAVAVTSSALLGTMTGSTAANITITGAFTIPMMKKSGYRPEQAAAIETAGSNGGQIMPPIMGAAAFVMAGYTGIPYIEIAAAAVVPALIYFGGLFLYTELSARKMRIQKVIMPVDMKQLLLDAPLFFVPLAVLIALLIIGYTLPFVGFWSILSLVVIALLNGIRKEARLKWSEVVDKMVSGVYTAAHIAVMLALINIVATCIQVSGLGTKLPIMIQDISQGRLIIALLIAMASSILLGMGVNTVAAYLLVAIGLSPALADMGVPLLQAHLFPFIFAAFSHLTPPVAIGALIAARIADANYWRTTVEALKAAFTAFLLPFLVIYVPVIILRPEGGVLISTALFIGIILGIASLQFAISNYCGTELRRDERILFVVASVLCLVFVFVKGYPYLIGGAALFAVNILRQYLRARHRIATTLT